MNIVSKNRKTSTPSRTTGDWWTRVSAMTRMMAAVAFTGIAVTACGSDSPTAADVLSTITVTPNNGTVAASGTQQFTARGTDSSGDSVALISTWSVVSGGGSISPTGMYTAGTAPGIAVVRATNGSISGQASITVTAAALASLAITPRPITVNAGATQQFTVTGQDVNGNTVAVTPVWSVGSGGGTINPTTGLFTAGPTAGTYTNTVVATFGGITANATVTIPTNAVATLTITPSPVGIAVNGTQQFTAVARDAGGAEVPFTPTWSVVGGGGTINATTGVYTAGATGGTFANSVRVASGSIVGMATVNLNTGPLATITVSSTATSVVPNGTQTFTAVGRDAGGNVFLMTPVWSVTNGGGTINPATGVFTAGATAGTYTGTINATSGGITGTANAVVMPVLATITLLPDPVSIEVNGTRQFTAVGRDAQGNVIPLNPVWSVVNGGGTINATTGMFTAGATAGTYTSSVRATSGSVSTSATVTVTPAASPASLINLGTAGANAISAATSVTCVNGGRITGDVSVSPGTTAVNFGGLCTSTGTVHISNPTASLGQIALGAAYTELDGLTCPTANAITGNLGGTTRTPGVYCTTSGITVNGTLTLNAGGDPNAIFVFRSGTSLTGAGNIVLTNGAQAKNVYWQVGTTATLATSSYWQGNILAQGNISMADHAILFGRALSRNGSVALGVNNVVALP